eukprot:TRINITY_DN15475_c0_g2_i1.p1 TRINITY_DN15475_c0_g2~~TRINITY_DN15475_c0_g2_i1.p1  ORF type:complete len:390 (+),score=27.70 TRINITY_DN15475_c0_g2_i1:371-1540(+)
MLWKRVREENAATLIQSRFKGYCTRKAFVGIVHHRYILLVTNPTLTIQRHWRRYKIICAVKLEALREVIHEYYNRKAKKITHWYKGIMAQRKIKFYWLAKRLRAMMIMASIKIRSVWLGYHTRKLYKEVKFYERNFISIKWTGEGKEAMLIGDMTSPPWIERIKMDYCALRRIHIKYFLQLDNGTYYYNHIVDGQITVAQDQPRISCMGIKCNVLSVAGHNRNWLAREHSSELEFAEIKGILREFSEERCSSMTQGRSLFESFDMYELEDKSMCKQNSVTLKREREQEYEVKKDLSDPTIKLKEQAKSTIALNKEGQDEICIEDATAKTHPAERLNYNTYGEIVTQREVDASEDTFNINNDTTRDKNCIDECNHCKDSKNIVIEHNEHQ